MKVLFPCMRALWQKQLGSWCCLCDHCTCPWSCCMLRRGHHQAVNQMRLTPCIPPFSSCFLAPCHTSMCPCSLCLCVDLHGNTSFVCSSLQLQFSLAAAVVYFLSLQEARCIQGAPSQGGGEVWPGLCIAMRQHQMHRRQSLAGLLLLLPCWLQSCGVSSRSKEDSIAL